MDELTLAEVRRLVSTPALPAEWKQPSGSPHDAGGEPPEQGDAHGEEKHAPQDSECHTKQSGHAPHRIGSRRTSTRDASPPVAHTATRPLSVAARTGYVAGPFGASITASPNAGARPD